MAARIEEVLGEELFSQVQIIHSRVGEIDEDKPTILVLHDLPEDPMNAHLKNGGWKRFDQLVFVSHWQQQRFHHVLGVPLDSGIVLRNFIEPIEHHEKPKDEFNIIYTSTPHRGLDLAFAAFENLAAYCEKSGLLVPKFKVFSSFDLYGWGERDKHFAELFQALDNHPHVQYSKSVPNEQIREELKKAHVFMLPSTWQETSCLALIEAMSANCMCIHSSLAALPETSIGASMMYPYSEDKMRHLNILTNVLFGIYELKQKPDFEYTIPKGHLDSIYGPIMAKTLWQTVVSNLLQMRK
jgi:UDP-glucose:(glucosyl)LPS alpha-1,2-glucosyltransferase